MVYDIQYFINKFMAIPENRWSACMEDADRRCAVGHCESEEHGDLSRLFKKGPACIGYTIHGFCDKEWGVRPHERTPRGRTLAALRWLEEQEQGKHKKAERSSEKAAHIQDIVDAALEKELTCA